MVSALKAVTTACGKQPGQKPRPRVRVFIEMERARRPVAQRALRHHRQHAGAGTGLQHDIAGPDRGGLQSGIGQWQRCRELLQPDLLLGAPCVGGLQRGDGVQHRQHAARPVRTGAAGAAHAPAVALEEQQGGGFGGLVGVLPDPAAVGVGGAEGLSHGVPEGRGIEGAAGLQHGQQGLGRGEQGIARGRTGRRCGRVDGGGGKGRTREGVRRRAGVEHGPVSVLKGIGPALDGCEVRLPPRPAGPPQTGCLPPVGAGRGGGVGRQRGVVAGFGKEEAVRSDRGGQGWIRTAGDFSRTVYRPP